MDNRRQNKIGSLMKDVITEILMREGKGIYGSALVSVTNVRVTSDLSLARFYFSIFNSDNKETVLKALNEAKSNLKRLIVSRMKDLRKMPEFEFYLDETMDEMFKIDEIFKKIHEDDERIAKNE